MLMLQLRMSRVTEEQLQKLNIDYLLSEHLIVQCRVGPGFEESFDDDDPTDNEQARVDSNLESGADEEEDSEMGEVVSTPTDTRSRTRLDKDKDQKLKWRLALHGAD
ncbi:hypothetical protein HAX54_040146 [Datura stramonium]|uniref:Uncharacterized protein n=1 Tax=Datura stramonium TaxID=4076 RepID=A0ABS8VRT2_DATST|nr:hypothetical protein [Datura stramonium]